jgi:hypothetical protein
MCSAKPISDWKRDSGGTLHFFYIVSQIASFVKAGYAAAWMDARIYFLNKLNSLCLRGDD